jgi:hypothetical protein
VEGGENLTTKFHSYQRSSWVKKMVMSALPCQKIYYKENDNDKREREKRES